MRVAQINFIPAPSGLTPAETLVLWPSLVDIAEAAASAGTRITVIQAAAYDEHLSCDGIDYLFTDVREAKSAAGRGEHFARLLTHIGADVLHVHGLGYARDAFAISQCLPALPILLQDHANRPPHWWRRPQWRRWYQAASGIAFTAAEQAQPFIRAGLFAPRTRLFCVPESSTRFTPGSRSRSRVETGLHGDPCVVWVGHLNPNKDPLTVLDGVARAATRLPGLQLWCAYGAAPLHAQVQRRIADDLRLKGRVHLLGKVAHSHVETLMRSADLFVSASHSESTGYALLEALACGVTPVVTDIPSFRELTAGMGHLWRRGDAGALADALVLAAAEQPSREKVRAHFDATLSLAAVGKQWADAYAQLLEDRQRGLP